MQKSRAVVEAVKLVGKGEFITEILFSVMYLRLIDVI